LRRCGWDHRRGADASRNFSLSDVHIEGSERIAEAVAKYDVDRFIHVSSFNANPNSSSEFFATKVPNKYPGLVYSSTIASSMLRSRRSTVV
jgi:hypothetical protein